MKTILLFASISFAAGLVFVNTYTSLIDAKSWGGNMPHSIDSARSYFKNVNPGNFFRIFSPLNQGLALLVMFLFWRTDSTIRLYLVIALVMYVFADAFTFMYFYPRNEIMFRTASLSDINLLKKTWMEWNSMNWVRTLMLIIGLIFSCLSLHSFYLLQPK